MAFFSFRECNIQINRQIMYINRADLSVEATISPNILIGDSSPTGYAGTQGVLNSLRLNYYLTGHDSVRDFLSDDTSFISGSIAGLSFKSGVLRSYNFNAQPYSPAEVQAEINFWDPLQGTFTPVSEDNIEFNPLHLTHALLEGHQNLGTFEHAISFSYQGSIEVFPSYRIGSIYPDGVVFGQRSAVGTFSYDGFSGVMPPNGVAARLRISLQDISGVVQESFTIEGPLFKRELSAETRGPIVSTVNIRQDALFRTPMITDVYPNPAGLSDLITISGAYPNNVSQVYFGALLSPGWIEHGGNSITAVVPDNTVDAYIYVTTNGGTARSTNIFDITGNFPEF